MSLLEKQSDIDVVGEADNGRKAETEFGNSKKGMVDNIK